MKLLTSLTRTIHPARKVLHSVATSVTLPKSRYGEPWSGDRTPLMRGMAWKWVGSVECATLCFVSSLHLAWEESFDGGCEL